MTKNQLRNRVFLHDLHILDPVRIRFWLPFSQIDSLLFWFDENGVDFNSGLCCFIRYCTVTDKRFGSLFAYKTNNHVPRSESYSFGAYLTDEVYKAMTVIIARNAKPDFSAFEDFYDIASHWLFFVTNLFVDPPEGNQVELSFREQRVRQMVLKGYF